MSKIWILISIIGALGCANFKGDSRTAQSPIDFTGLRQLQLPFGNRLLNDPAFQVEPYSWGDSIFLKGKSWQLSKLDSLWFAPNTIVYPTDSSISTGFMSNLDKLPRGAKAAIKEGVDYFEDLIYTKDLVASRYFVLGKDTVVLLDDIGEYPVPDQEGTSYFNYTIAATVKNRLLNDFLLFSYQLHQLYDEPGRYFWVEGNSIRTVDLAFGEENSLLGHADYTIENHRFVRKQ